MRAFGRIAVFFVISLLPAATAQKTLSELVEEISQERLETHVQALASPRSEPDGWAYAQQYIVDELTSYGYDVLLEPVQSFDGYQSNNIIASLPGTGSSGEVFIVGAHYDTVEYTLGADDNASGVAGLLEIARALRGQKYPSEIQFVAFALEEQGALGSQERASALRRANAKVRGAIALEMIGYTCDSPGCIPSIQLQSIPFCFCVRDRGADLSSGDWIGIVANDNSSSLMNTFTRAADNYVPVLKVATGQVAENGDCFSDTQRSDHGPFWFADYPAIMVTDTAEFRNPNYHQASDTPDTLNYTFMRQVTQAILAATIAHNQGDIAPPSFGCCFFGTSKTENSAWSIAGVLLPLALMLIGMRRMC
ncbi:MAG: M28 family peptidase, partial [Candidatus Hydrogenedentes bacterium]|nr:M28 family peptidase [Candidatus Hydrogenedentota bacterium]